MNKIPTGVKVISMLYYFVAISWIVVGILLLVLGSGSFTSLTKTLPILRLLGDYLSVIPGLFLIILGFIVLLVGRGLWKGRNWARIVVIIFAGIIIILGGLTMAYRSIEPLGSVIINTVIGLYLLFNGKVKKSFSWTY